MTNQRFTLHLDCGHTRDVDRLPGWGSGTHYPCADSACRCMRTIKATSDHHARITLPTGGHR